MRILGLVLSFAALNVIACGQSNRAGSSSDKMSFFSNKPNFTLALTDAPADKNISSVYVNIDHAELRVEKGDRKPWVIVANGLGSVDLMTLRNGVTLPMDSVAIPIGAQVTQIRLVLRATGNYITYNGEERCDLKTPSEQKTGIKLLINKGIDVQAGYTYKVVADFDAEKSIVLQGNGGCLLKPVLKLKSASRIAPEEPVDEGQTPPSEQPLPAEGDNSGDDGTGGFEPPYTGDDPAIPIEDLNQYMM